MRNKLYIIAQSLQQPRVIKRIFKKSTEYDEVFVYGFKRNFYDVNNIELLKDRANVEVSYIGTINNTHYLKRIFLFLKLIFLINSRNILKRKNVYVFGLDLRFMSLFFINSNISYEISDIMWLYLKRTPQLMLMKLDFFLARNSLKTYFTSEGFYKYYYNFLPNNQVEIIENKFETYGKVFPLEKLKNDRIRVAYVGAFRYPTIISDLLEVFKRNPQMDLNFYGDGFGEIIHDIEEASRQYNNISYSGAFKNPIDLQEIYSENNLNFVAYDNQLGNERVAMPNKFYESGFFNIPIICSKNTHVGERVLALQMGWNINPVKSSMESFFTSLNIADILACHERIKLLDKALFLEHN